MSIRKLPKTASLENLKKQAKSLQHAAKKNDKAALARIRTCFDNPQATGLQDAQLVVAREYGFSSWRKLREHLDSAQASDNRSIDQLSNEFLRLIVLVYSETEHADPARFVEAMQLLQEHPEISSENIYCAAASGNADLVKDWLDRDPALLDQKGGYHNWEPIMYAAYARPTGDSTLAVAKLLLERGANPNAYYMWGGQYRFTALTGVFGHGEGGVERLPEHPDCERFARMLLESGANPNDSQAAYNRMLAGDISCLKLLLEYGLSSTDKNNWLLKNGDELTAHPDNTLHYQFCHAIHTDDFDKLRLTVEHGVDVNQQQEGRSPYQMATLAGNQKFIEYLQANGAEPIELAASDRFRLACLAADRDQARALLKLDPALVAETHATTPDLLEHALAKPEPDALQLMIELGFDVNHFTYRSALHQAAWLGRIDMMKLLIDAGADPTRRDHFYFGPPLAWALQNNQAQAAEFLDGCEMDIFSATARGNLALLETLLAADASLLETRFADIRPNPDKSCEMDWMTPLAFAVASKNIESVKFLLSYSASPLVNDNQGRSIRSLAQEGGNVELIELIQRAK